MSVGKTHLSCLVVIILLGAWLRIQGLNWDQGYHLQPDERYISLVLTALGPPESWREYIDPNLSSLSPYIHGYGAYIYGQLPLTVLTYLSRWLGMEGYDRAYLLGRGISAMLDTLSIVLVYKLGKKLWNGKVGIIGAGFYAFSPLAIQYSHFMTMESWVTFIWLAVILILTRLPRRGAAGLAMTMAVGVLLGAAGAVKASSVVLMPLVMVTVGLLSFKDSPWRTPRRILLIILAAIFSFRFFQPTIFQSASWLDWSIRKDFYQAFNFQRLAIDGRVMFPPQWQWVGTARWWFPLKNIGLWGMGPAAAGLAAIGIIWQIWQIRRISPVFAKAPAFAKASAGKQIRLILAVWIVVIFFWQGEKFVKSIRYFLPFFPLYALFAAGAIDGFKRSNLAAARLDLRTIAVALSVTSSAVWALMFTNIYRTPTTRVAASEWIYKNIPPLGKIMLEEWDDPLPVSMPGYETVDYQTEMVGVYAPDDDKKKDQIDRWVRNFDWIVLSSPRAKGNIGELPREFPLMSSFYSGLDSGKLGFTKVAEFASVPKFSIFNFQFSIDDSSAEESFWVYDHPKVEIYQKLDRGFGHRSQNG
jgi:hypothetical protein